MSERGRQLRHLTCSTL